MPVGQQSSKWFQATVIAALALIAWGVWSRPAADGLSAAFAQARPGGAANANILAFTGPIGRNESGLFLVDVENGTIWCYSVEFSDGVRKLQLVAARSWLYDRHLQDYNNLSPTVRQVQQLISQQRTRPEGELRWPNEMPPRGEKDQGPEAGQP
jgi:hypothetical protein